MKIKTIILLFIFNCYNHINSMELLCLEDNNKFKSEIKHLKKYLSEKDINIENDNYIEHSIKLCFDHRQKNKSILNYAIKDCLTGGKLILKFLLGSGIEIPENVKDYIDEYLSYRYGTLLVGTFTRGREIQICWAVDNPHDKVFMSGIEFVASLPSFNLHNVTARIIHIRTNKSILHNPIEKFCKAIEESENEKKVLVQNNTNLPNDLIGLIFTYLNTIKWKKFHEIDQTQFNS